MSSKKPSDYESTEKVAPTAPEANEEKVDSPKKESEKKVGGTSFDYGPPKAAPSGEEPTGGRSFNYGHKAYGHPED